MESDEALRLRVPAAFEGLSVAGPTAAYEFHARSADGRVADASATSPAPAEVVLTVLSREAKQGDYLVGTDENVLVLNRTYANRSNAERAAKMQWERLQRGVASFSLQLAEGRADLYTEMPVKVSGFKQPIDDAEWTITTLTHTVSPDNGFTTSLELEVRIDDFEME
ncbi:contractile injection system protein, VgrG/Pvc8 family [Escherichia coli]|nr:baseplate J/gp47 family protein [Escherichia coli]MCS0770132.1 contractile injection system protein, VgrG/Pvc8 family [Escherichia coli]MDC6994503.1 contractile injection system protein, VgrG/Pvc8 family [Escherichia coli]MED8149033.1 contractile injection system protein, VgrG/Pvc8 family [Escherichia coli]